MDGDIKEVIGALMRVFDGATISRAEVEDLAFEADGELRTALNEADIKLMEFACDCDSGQSNQKLSDDSASGVAAIPRRNYPMCGLIAGTWA